LPDNRKIIPVVATHNEYNIGVEQTPRKVCLKWKASGGAAHAGRSQRESE